MEIGVDGTKYEWREQVIFFGNIDHGDGKFHDVKMLPKPGPIDLTRGQALCVTKDTDNDPDS